MDLVEPRQTSKLYFLPLPGSYFSFQILSHTVSQISLCLTTTITTPPPTKQTTNNNLSQKHSIKPTRREALPAKRNTTAPSGHPHQTNHRPVFGRAGGMLRLAAAHFPAWPVRPGPAFSPRLTPAKYGSKGERRKNRASRVRGRTAYQPVRPSHATAAAVRHAMQGAYAGEEETGGEGW